MSPAERFVRHQKIRTDRAISQAYDRLATQPRARATFEEMLGCVRHRSPGLLLAPTVAVLSERPNPAVDAQTHG